jgi:rRNA maturation endonuclease Nob1
MEWTLRIDDALLQKINMARRCRECKRELPAGHPYTICDQCYSARYLDMEY